MALINCPDCGQPVSDQASACPKCARPLGQSVASLGRGPVQTVEQTGKKWKMAMAVSGGFIVVGGVMFGASYKNGQSGGVGAVGAVLLALGLVGYLIARLGAWWQHG